MYRVSNDSICVVIDTAKYSDEHKVIKYLKDELHKKIESTEAHYFNRGRIIQRKVLIIIHSAEFFTDDGVLEVSKYCIANKIQHLFVNNIDEANRLMKCCIQEISSKEILDFSALQTNNKKKIVLNMFTELLEKPNGYFKGKGLKLKDIVNLYYSDKQRKE
eukprot:GAHX01000051.1.p1 GENE.GAHX01000051.1~~GAHX01000051.1.p1  ORF type:complete len:161 (+),score=31.67 GAHX01000051.1:56-538(+)